MWKTILISYYSHIATIKMNKEANKPFHLGPILILQKLTLVLEELIKPSKVLMLFFQWFRDGKESGSDVGDLSDWFKTLRRKYTPPSDFCLRSPIPAGYRPWGWKSWINWADQHFTFKVHILHLRYLTHPDWSENMFWMVHLR